MNKDERQSIYEIYRACRLCGESSGYKMPIIQSIIDADGEEVDLQRKIRECIQLEVTLNDRMPPLICEMCVEQINDFYEFREMCHKINTKTRLRLGLPLQTTPELARPRQKEDSTFDTESIQLNTDSEDGEPLSRQILLRNKPKPKSVKAKKEGDVQIKIQNYQPQLMSKENERSVSPEVNERRETRRNRGSSPKRTKPNVSKEIPLSGLQGMQVLKPSTRAKAGPKSLLRRDKEKQAAERENENDEENDDAKSLLAVRQKRLREKDNINYSDETPTNTSKKPKLSTPEPPKLDKFSRPGPKSFKTSLNAEQISTPKLGPKSKKREPSPPPELSPPQQKATPKSRRSDTSNESVKNKKSELSTGPKSRKSELTVISEVKSRKCEVLVKKTELELSVSKSNKQYEASPITTSRSKPKRPAPTPSPPPVEPPQQKVYQCNICGIKARAPQGLSSHVKTHVPSFTLARLSCNPCELWFNTVTEASLHHKEHTDEGKPYTCGKCYDDFDLIKDYELHFTRNQCLPTYEVPDVKCERCWHTYPTYKLLEEHRCQGEGARPGGNCSKCKRSFATQKSLATHEVRCSVVKKKGGNVKEAPAKVKNEPIIIDPEVSRSLLPMEVRIVKCDAILKNLGQGNYDVKGISHRFGLDSNSSYPYLYSMGDDHVKIDSIDNLDHIDSTKDDSQNDSFVHWDSDDSDTDICIDISFESRTVEKLSTLTLKTLFSPKCLGKVPRKKHTFSNEKTFKSILSIDFPGDIKKNIDRIIDNLGNDSQSDNYDSDSILDKRTDQSESVTDFDNLKENPIETKNLEENESHSDKYDSNDKVENLNDVGKDAKMTENCSVDDYTENNVVRIENSKVSNENDANFDENTQSNSAEEINSTNVTETNHTEMKTAHDDVINENNNENQLKDEDPEQTPFKNESSLDKVKVEINTETGEGKMDVDEQTELEPANNANSKITDTIDKINTIENEELPNNSESNNDMKTEDSIKSFDTAVHDSNDENNDSESIEMINHNAKDTNITLTDAKNCEEINDTNDENNHSPSSIATNHNETENINDLKDDTQSTNTITEAIDDLNVETHDSNLNDDVDRKLMNDSSNDNYNSQINDKNIEPENDFDKVADSKNEFEDRISEESKQIGLNFNSILTDDENLSSNVQITDKFNIDDLNDEEKQLMAELDEQIGEGSDVIGGNISESDLIGQNKTDDDIFGENRSGTLIEENRADDIENKANHLDSENSADIIKSGHEVNSGMIPENKADDMIDENRADKDVISENRVDLSKNESNIIIPNVGFSDMDVDENNDFNTLMKKHDDLTSLDLDNVSDEEFDFDA